MMENTGKRILQKGSLWRGMKNKLNGVRNTIIEPLTYLFPHYKIGLWKWKKHFPLWMGNLHQVLIFWMKMKI